MRILVWLLRAAVFFALFAFALNNLDDARIKWFFGYESRAPMVFVMLVVFALGCVFGVLAMVPSWWRHRRVARQQQRGLPAKGEAVLPPAASAPVPLVDLPLPRDAF